MNSPDLSNGSPQPGSGAHPVESMPDVEVKAAPTLADADAEAFVAALTDNRALLA